MSEKAGDGLRGASGEWGGGSESGPHSSGGPGCLGLILALVIFWGLFFIANVKRGGSFFGFSRRSPAIPREKACYANMRVLLGAVEMYNMDHSTMVDTIKDWDAGPSGFLVKDKYLKSPLTKPEPGCRYEGIDLTSATPSQSIIRCDVHGTVE